MPPSSLQVDFRQPNKTTQYSECLRLLLEFNLYERTEESSRYATIEATNFNKILVKPPSLRRARIRDYLNTPSHQNFIFWNIAWLNRT